MGPVRVVTRSSPPLTRLRPAIGGGGRLSRKILIWQAVIAVALLLILGVAKLVVAAREDGPDPLSALPGGQTVAAGLDIGGTPTDYDLAALAANYRVDGVVNLGGASVVEQVTATSLHLQYLLMDVPPGAAPSRGQLQTLARFMRTQVKDGSSVYVHDDGEGGQSVVAACMLLLLRGSSWASVQHDITASALNTLSQRQLLAIRQLLSALNSRSQHGQSLSRNPYLNTRTDPW